MLKRNIFEYLAIHYIHIFTGNIIKEIIKFNHFDYLKLLVKHHLNINEKDKDGNTPLANAIIYKKHRMTTYLINRGANLHSINYNNETIYDQCLKNSKDYYGKTILHRVKRLLYNQ